MNSLLASYGSLDWKPLITALLLPPVPLLVLLIVGMGLRIGRRPLVGLLLIVLAFVGLWFSHCRVTGDWIVQRWIKPPPALQADRLAALKRELGGHRLAVVVLGGGRESYAPEYGDANLNAPSLQRLHYGLWLARRLDAPVMFSGGVGHSSNGDAAEAAVAARVAERDYGRAIRWQESQSTDTRGNARLSVPMLASQGVTDVLLVTHGWHMPRAQRAFEEAVALGGTKLRIVPAPMGLAGSSQQRVLDWLPSGDGYQRVRDALREVLGWYAGA